MKKIYSWRQLNKLKKRKNGIDLDVDPRLGGAFLLDSNRGKLDDKCCYFSTHTFYNKCNAEYATTKLQQCGWDVEIIPYKD